MTWTVRQSVIATLAYAHLFDYPLTHEELQRWLITDTEKDTASLALLRRVAQCHEGYFGLSRIKDHVRQRKQRFHASQEKMRIANRVAKTLSYIPTILLVGVSGGLAMNNADPDDDIDVFIISAPRVLWITRLLTLCVLELLGKRRKFGDTHVKNLICVNMIMDSNNLDLPHEERDLYSAHEVLQMIPLVNKRNVYQVFLRKNAWVQRYLYYAWQQNMVAYKDFNDRKNRTICALSDIFIALVRLFEYPVKHMQLWYMRRHKTTEKITDGMLRFHPKDTRAFIKQRYISLLRKCKIPLDRRFLRSLK